MTKSLRQVLACRRSAKQGREPGDSILQSALTLRPRLQLLDRGESTAACKGLGKPATSHVALHRRLAFYRRPGSAHCAVRKTPS